MNDGFSHRVCRIQFRRLAGVALVLVVLFVANELRSQTSSTGALTGTIVDVSGAALPDATITLSRNDGSGFRFTSSDEEGRFALLLLPPGAYRLQATKVKFQPLNEAGLQIVVTETIQVELRLQIATHIENLQVFSTSAMVQTDNSALGRVIDETTTKNLPLVTRNFTQLTGLLPGVTVGVYNAGELGSGGTALSQIGKSNDGIYVHGARSYDNDWQLDGIGVSDVQGSGSISGGIPIPNPNTIEEFKMQTGLYDAAFGRAAGANVSVITKRGSDAYHGSIFEFLRNDVLNANDFFFNHTHQPRPTLKQNQFGFTIGGPVRKDKLLFFGSYQGTRQVNGVAAGQSRIACSAALNEPPLTNDRSAKALGRMFGGMKGANGGVEVNPDGTNINPVALALLNFRLPDGSFLIPTPQTVDSSQPLARSGFSAFSQPCRFGENQELANIDYEISQKSRLATQFFAANNDQLITFPGGSLNPVANTRGFDSSANSEFVVFSLAHSYVLRNTMLNEARIGFVRTATTMRAGAPFKWSDVGVSESEMNQNNELPNLNIVGSVSMASILPRTYTQNSYVLNDVFSFLTGPHTLTFGGSVTRLQDNLDFSGAGSFVQFLSWPDFLLGLDAKSNGTETFSNVFMSSDLFGVFNREFRLWEGSAFAQDDIRVTPSLTVNLGARYERIGQFGDNLGRNSSFDASKANSNPPLTGSLDGYIVPSNFPAATPPGVIRAKNTFGNYGFGQNAFAPRLGFAWKVLPNSDRFVMRGGYGLYYSRPTGQAFTQSVLSAPFALTRLSSGPANSKATFQAPFADPFPTPASFPVFVPYSASTANGVNALAPDFRPAMARQFSLGIQTELHHDWMVETTYVGTQGTHLQRFRSFNQAMPASPSSPIRGVTSDTLANIGLRVPIPGIRPDALRELESKGSSWYNGLETSLTKCLSHGLQLLAAYTYSKVLDSDGADINSTSAANALTLGDQNSPDQRWGRASFDRTHRFVVSATWDVPGPSRGLQRDILGNWSLAAVATIQSGSALTISYTNSTNVFGISEDRAQLSGACSKSQFVAGNVESNPSNYFNWACFAKPPIIGADGIGTAFGDSATGIVDGPGQANLDVAISKDFGLRWPVENSSLQFRAEFFNALNHPQFANPDTNFSSPTFGVIASTAVNPRVGQVALSWSF